MFSFKVLNHIDEILCFWYRTDAKMLEKMNNTPPVSFFFMGYELIGSMISGYPYKYRQFLLIFWRIDEIDSD